MMLGKGYDAWERTMISIGVLGGDQYTFLMTYQYRLLDFPFYCALGKSLERPVLQDSQGLPIAQLTLNHNFGK